LVLGDAVSKLEISSSSLLKSKFLKGQFLTARPLLMCYYFLDLCGACSQVSIDGAFWITNAMKRKVLVVD